MKNISAFFIYLIASFGAFVFAQELPAIRNFTPVEYHGENQNWGIAQSTDQLIYVANSKGLIEYNSAAWTLYQAPNESIMRSVMVDENRVYTGCYMDFGFWEKDEYGALIYTSLSAKMNHNLIEDEEFWTIIGLDELVLFQSLDRIYMYNVDDHTVEIINSNFKITKMFKVDNRIYFQRSNDGIYKIENGKDILVTNDFKIRTKEVVNIFAKGNDLLIQSQDEGFYIYDGIGLKEWRHDASDLLSSVSAYSSIKLKNDGFLIGTISNGLIYLDPDGKLNFQIDKNKGLLNNTVLALFEDLDSNIWLGLDFGISNFNVNAPYNTYVNYHERIGSVYASAAYQGKLYLGSNQGLYWRDLKSTDEFTLISGTQGQVWSLKVIKGTLFCGHNSGTFTINANSATKISNVEGAWDIKPLGDDLLLQGAYDGLYVLEKKSGAWQVRNKIQNFDISSRHFEEMPDHEIFVNHEYKGIFKVKVDENYSEALNITIDTTLKGDNSTIIKYQGQLLYGYKKGVFKYEDAQNKFLKDSLLSMLYRSSDEFTSGELLHDDNSNSIWGFSKSSINLIAPGGVSSALKVKNIPITLALRKDLIGYENILQIDDSKFLFGNYSGYYTLDIDRLNTNKFEIFIDNIINKKRGACETSLQLNKYVNGDFSSDENSLAISFFVPKYFNYLETEYQYQLSGIYDEWSVWSNRSEELFENLPFGDYTFQVRARIGDEISSNIASYSFSIAKPWYISNLMVVLYILGMLLFSFMVHKAYKRYYRNQQQVLEEKSKRELELLQVRSEKEIIKLKNDGLRVDFRSKSKELAASTMSIIKKNELLNTIKNELNKLPDKTQVKPVVKIIDKNLKHNDDWEFFQEAFNNADSDFLKNIKALHPNLSPNDLKLCAYLRLNLSSKEIAPLLSISPRSVEIKRYRLRKKMNLAHEENLVAYIIDL